MGFGLGAFNRQHAMLTDWYRGAMLGGDPFLSSSSTAVTVYSLVLGLFFELFRYWIACPFLIIGAQVNTNFPIAEFFVDVIGRLIGLEVVQHFSEI